MKIPDLQGLEEISNDEKEDNIYLKKNEGISFRRKLIQQQMRLLR